MWLVGDWLGDCPHRGRYAPSVLPCAPSVLPCCASCSLEAPSRSPFAPPVLPQCSLMLPLKRPCSLSESKRVILDPKFGVYIIHIYNSSFVVARMVGCHIIDQLCQLWATMQDWTLPPIYEDLVAGGLVFGLEEL